jgi:glycosyltransferase involved in cell wall biosynthesis
VPDAKLIGAGAEPGGDYGDYIHRIVTDQNILGNVTFTGVIPFERLVTGYISANVVAMPSVYEAFPIVPLEAGITGRPVVASNIEGCSEVIVDGVTGLLVDPKDPHHLAAAVVKLLLNRELRQRMGNNAREYILKRYTWEIIGQKIEDQYSSFLGCGRKGG